MNNTNASAMDSADTLVADNKATGQDHVDEVNPSHHESQAQTLKTEAKKEKRKSFTEFLHLGHHDKDQNPTKEKRGSIADSGPFITEINPATGHLITRENPHWPEEDSWKRANLRNRGETDNTIAPGGISGFGVNNY